MRNSRWIQVAAIALLTILLLAALLITRPTSDRSPSSIESSVSSNGTLDAIVTTTTPVSMASTSLSTITRVITPPGGNGTLVSSVGANGVMLLAAINASSLVVGQSLQVNVSLFNTLSTADRIPVSHDWLFQGIPLALWGNCLVNNQGQSYAPAPAEVDVLQGFYTMQNLSSATSGIFVPYNQGCHESTGVTAITFWPASSRANLSLVYDQKNETSAPVSITDQFSSQGHWNLTYNLTPTDRNPQVPAFITYGNESPSFSPTATPFVPGVYTLAVSDEWGQGVMLHFYVLPETSAP